MAIHQNVLELIGNTPVVKAQRLDTGPCSLFLKLESTNPGGSIKDRIGLSLIEDAERTGKLKPGGVLVEGTAGNTGLALALVAQQKGYRLILVVPDKMSREKIFNLKAMGAEVILTRSDVAKGHPDYYQDLAARIASETPGAYFINQFGNPDNPLAHFDGTGPEIWQQTGGQITHFVSSMGTTGTIMGTSRFLKSKNAAIEIIGCQPADGAQIPGIRKWPEAYLPRIYDASRVDRIESVNQADAEEMTRRLAREEGIFAGISSGGAMAVAVRIAEQVSDAVIVSIVCDRGDRYLSTGVFPA